jgi:SAM-dependent methyltransferase
MTQLQSKTAKPKQRPGPTLGAKIASHFTPKTKSQLKSKHTSKLTVEQKYQLYEDSVQNPENEVKFVERTFKKIRNRSPRSLREDFGGTGFFCSEWVKRHSENQAVGVDLDPEPIHYGKKHHWAKLTPDQQARMQYAQRNVLECADLKADAICAYNFSYFIFKTRDELREYFRAARRALTKDGIFYLDIFGGPESQTLLEEETEHDQFSYFWDCEDFNPVTHHCRFSIHFKVKGKKKQKNVFTYDWRFWTLPEINELLLEAGFKETKVFWEGDDGEGGGNGIFRETKVGEVCESWVSYVLALP